VVKLAYSFATRTRHGHTFKVSFSRRKSTCNNKQPYMYKEIFISKQIQWQHSWKTSTISFHLGKLIINITMNTVIVFSHSYINITAIFLYWSIHFAYFNVHTCKQDHVSWSCFGNKNRAPWSNSHWFLSIILQISCEPALLPIIKFEAYATFLLWILNSVLNFILNLV